jgi:hypothetical protein
MIKIDQASFKFTIIAIGNAEVSMEKASKAALQAGGDEFQRQLRGYVSRTDHSLADLARMGHPYAKKHGSIQIHKKTPWIVHAQSGTMKGAIRGGLKQSGTDLAYELTFDTGKAPHAKYVIEGTNVMLPRDVIWETGHHPIVRRKIVKAIFKKLGQGLRSQAVVRIG